MTINEAYYFLQRSNDYAKKADAIRAKLAELRASITGLRSTTDYSRDRVQTSARPDVLADKAIKLAEEGEALQMAYIEALNNSIDANMESNEILNELFAADEEEGIYISMVYLMDTDRREVKRMFRGEDLEKLNAKALREFARRYTKQKEGKRNGRQLQKSESDH